MDISLTVEEFADAVRKGKGRAVLLASKDLSDEYRAVVLQACREDQRLDSQSECTRSEYLLNLVERCGLREEVFLILQSEIPEKDSWDQLQRTRLLGGFVDEYPAALEILQTAARVPDLQSVDVLAERGWIDWVVEHILSIVPEDDLWQTGGWLDDSPNMSERSREILTETKVKNDLYWEGIRASRLDERNPTFEEAILRIKTTEQYVGDLRLIGKELSDEQVRIVADLWIAEKHRRRAQNYARLFDQRPYPYSAERIVTLVRKGEMPIDFEDVLATKSDPLARELGIELIEAEVPDFRGFRCMSSSLVRGDRKYMLERLDRFLTIDATHLHWLVLDLLRIVKGRPKAQRKPFLIWIYENSPCSFCRGSAAWDMNDDGTLPDNYRDELRFDVDDDGRAVATKIGYG